MIRVVGVRFRTAGKIYFFDPLQFELKRGDNVIVETARGIEFGTAVSGVREVEDSAVVQPLKPILRIANQRDKEQEAGNKEKEKEAFKICLEKIQKHGLEMKLIDAEYTFDNNKILFYFTADGRIDFRELVKDLAGVFKTRIELRQIGVRDETKIMGGIGICGRPLCCHSYLSDFIAVSIKMAKEQNLSLNPTKISGVCGRLMCCLKNEEETYEELNRKLPNVGDYVVTTDGQRGEVHSVNVLRQLVKVLVESGDDKELKEYNVEQLRFHKHHGKKGQANISPEELKELERLVREEQEELGVAGVDEEAGSSREGRQKNGDRRPRQDRGERQGKDGQDKGNRQGDGQGKQGKPRQEKGERQGKDGQDKNRQGDGQDRGERQGKDGQDKNDRQDRRQGDHKEQPKDGEKQGERQDRGRQGDGQGKQGKPRQDRNRQGDGQGKDGQDKGDRQDRGRQGDGQEKAERQDRGRQGDGQDKAERQDRGRQGDGQGKQGKQDKKRGLQPDREEARQQKEQGLEHRNRPDKGAEKGSDKNRNHKNRFFRDKNRNRNNKPDGAKGEQE